MWRSGGSTVGASAALPAAALSIADAALTPPALSITAAALSAAALSNATRLRQHPPIVTTTMRGHPLGPLPAQDCRRLVDMCRACSGLRDDVQSVRLSHTLGASALTSTTLSPSLAPSTLALTATCVANAVANATYVATAVVATCGGL